jgi:hypothetical protein
VLNAALTEDISGLFAHFSPATNALVEQPIAKNADKIAGKVAQNPANVHAALGHSIDAFARRLGGFLDCVGRVCVNRPNEFIAHRESTRELMQLADRVCVGRKNSRQVPVVGGDLLCVFRIKKLDCGA